MGGLDGLTMFFRFDDHVLDTERRELRRAADLVALDYLLFDLFLIWYATLAESPARVIASLAVRLRTRIRLLQGLATPPN
jgi:hypothetical protein